MRQGPAGFRRVPLGSAQFAPNSAGVPPGFCQGSAGFRRVPPCSARFALFRRLRPVPPASPRS
eukprot:3925750-Alexandrium_andersonii.AAC.1